MGNQFYSNLITAAQQCDAVKEEHPEYRFRIETNVRTSRVKVMVINKNKIIKIITYDEFGEITSKDGGLDHE